MRCWSEASEPENRQRQPRWSCERNRNMLASNWLRACGESVNPGQHLVGLNDAQRAAAAYGPRPLLVIAGAGSGKTNTLAHRVANLVVHGADPRRILLLGEPRARWRGASSELWAPP